MQPVSSSVPGSATLSPDPTHPAPESPQRPRPKSVGDLFLSFTVLALQGFGGVLAVVQREIVERKGWLTPDEFLEDWAVAQVLPGPNVINLAVLIGDRYFGLRGAAASAAGLLCAPLVIVLALAFVYAQYAGDARVAGALRGMGAIAGGLIAATGLKLLGQLRKHPLGFRLCLVIVALVFGAIAWARIPLGWVLLTVGSAACVATWRRIAP